MCDFCDLCKSCEDNNWIALVYKLPAIPSKFRVNVWRELKKYGAIYLQQSVAVLPKSSRCTEIFKKLEEKIVSYSGEATLINFQFENPQDAAEAYKSYNGGINEEFNLIEEVRKKILFDLKSAKEANLLTLNDLKEKLSTLKKLKRNYNSIILRDCRNCLNCNNRCNYYNKFLSIPFEKHLNDLIVRVRNDIDTFENSKKSSSND